ncbi:MAG TPA: 2'-5' RNA ligase family protein [Gaiellaceae bacterium]|nr:2'-5' RNA ligase family protein [Gaiellaceae bacterium]
MAAGDRPLETAITLILADQAPALAEAHDELYPERIPEHIPLSLTLLYPFAPVAELNESLLERVGGFFASRPPLVFDLTRLAQWDESGAVYAVPEPDDDLRATMRALWRLFPEFPPYHVPGSDPPPHASLTLSDHGDRAGTRARAGKAAGRAAPGALRAHGSCAHAGVRAGSHARDAHVSSGRCLGLQQRLDRRRDVFVPERLLDEEVRQAG